MIGEDNCLQNIFRLSAFPRVHSSMLVGSRPAIRLYTCNQGCRVKPLILILVLAFVLVLVLVLVLIMLSSATSIINKL